MKNNVNKCNECGRFKKWSELMSMQAEGDDTWFECKKCMSESDLRDFLKMRETYMINEVKQRQDILYRVNQIREVISPTLDFNGDDKVNTLLRRISISCDLIEHELKPWCQGGAYKNDIQQLKGSEK